MSAAQRLNDLDQTDAIELCERTESALVELIALLNKETTLLRAGHLKEAGTLSAEKAQRSQDYVVLARSVQRVAERLKATAPEHIQRLQQRHESFATQMAENLRVLATARNLTEDLLTDVAKTVGVQQAPKTYGRSGGLNVPKGGGVPGLAVNRAL